MLDKLSTYIARHETLSNKLADPSIMNNREEYMALSKEFSEIQEYFDLYHLLKKAQSDLSEAKNILSTERDIELLEMARTELLESEKRIELLEKKAEELMNPPDPFDGKNVILEIRAGTGGDEAGLFAADLFRMYGRYAERRGWKVEILSQSFSNLDGFKEVIAMITGHRVYGSLKHESGVHRVQRVPLTETSGRIHTSAVTVAILPEAEQVEIEIDPNDIRIDVFRSSGPGGQSVNTTDSAIRITHLATGLIVSCQDEKSQLKNKAKALKILYSRLLDLKRREQDAKIAAERREMVSTGDRSAKIRTYNFPQSRITDHRINFTSHRLDQVLQGEMDDIIEALHDFYRLQALETKAGSSGKASK